MNSSFENLRLSGIVALIEILEEGPRTRDTLARRYHDRALHFDVTLGLLLELGLIRENHGRLNKTSRCPSARDDGFPRVVFERLLRTNGPYRSELADYLRQYRVAEDRLWHEATAEDRASQAPVRNLLMEINAVVYDAAADAYFLNNHFAHLYPQAIQTAREVSPYMVKRRIADKDALGRRVEQVVVDYEKQRLGNALESRVVHIASSNAAAGYDIESVTVLGPASVVPRCIEVKAVSPHDWGFYWTSNERDVARSIGAWYYLYLVPVRQQGDPDISAIRTIANPSENVLAPDSDWEVEVDVLRCSLARND